MYVSLVVLDRSLTVLAPVRGAGMGERNARDHALPGSWVGRCPLPLRGRRERQRQINPHTGQAAR